MSNTGHYLEQPSNPRLPGVVFGVHIDTVMHGTPHAFSITRNTFGIGYVSLFTRRKEKWNRPISAEFKTGQAMHEWMRARSVSGRINWCVCTNAVDALTLSEWFTYADSRKVTYYRNEKPDTHDRRVAREPADIEIGACALFGRAHIFEYRECGCVWRWVSLSNYLPSPEDEQGRDQSTDGASRLPGLAGGVDITDPGFTTSISERNEGTIQQDSIGKDVCRDNTTNNEGCNRSIPFRGGIHENRAEETAARFIGLVEWWRRYAKAPFGMTIGQLAMGMLRTHCPPKVLSTHNHKDTLILERRASYGERASVFYRGRITRDSDEARQGSESSNHNRYGSIIGPITLCDINSMHPSILRDRSFPVRRISYKTNCRPSDPIELAEDIGVIANVTIRTEVPEYPLRSGENIIYPVGTFTTTLTGPELLRLKRDGEVLQCHELATYEMGNPFAATVEQLLRIRTSAEIAKDSYGVAFSKLIANNIGGKLAQRKGTWQHDSFRDGWKRWGEDVQYNATSGQATRYRYICGIAFKWKQDEFPPGPHTQCFAYLCAYGRLMMRDIRELAGPKTVVAQCSDGIWLLPHGVDVLAGYPHVWGLTPGKLRADRTVYDAEFVKPRLYRVGNRWTLAGFCSPQVTPDGRYIYDSFSNNPVGKGTFEAPNWVDQNWRKSAITYDDDVNEFTDDGWNKPIMINHECKRLFMLHQDYGFLRRSSSF